MQHETNSSDDETKMRPDATVAMFVAVCAKHLEHAIDDSRTEMDKLTSCIFEDESHPSTEVITRLQSIDRFMQRLRNVKSNLNHLAAHMEGDANEASLQDLATQLRSSFTMSSERELFDAMTGVECQTKDQADDTVELF